MPHRPDVFASDLALVQEKAFSGHADAVAPDLIRLLAGDAAGVRQVLEIGAGTGALTRHLVAAGHDVIATDASDHMLRRLRHNLPEVGRALRLRLPEDTFPPYDALIGVGHVLNYLPDEGAVLGVLQRVWSALRPGGLIAVDVCDLSWKLGREKPETILRRGEGWRLETTYSIPHPEVHVRDMIIRVATRSGWRESRGRQANRLFDLHRLVADLRDRGVAAHLGDSFGRAPLPSGMFALTARRPPPPPAHR